MDFTLEKKAVTAIKRIGAEATIMFHSLLHGAWLRAHAAIVQVDDVGGSSVGLSDEVPKVFVGGEFIG